MRWIGLALNTAVGIKNILQDRAQAEFQGRTEAQLQQTLSQSLNNTHKIGNVELGVSSLKDQLTEAQSMLVSMKDRLELVESQTLGNLLAVQMMVMAQGTATAFIRTADVIDTFMSTLITGKTPPGLFAGSVWVDVSKYVSRKYQLQLSEALQESESTFAISSDKQGYPVIHIISSLIATEAPRAIYEMIPLPTWLDGQLFQPIFPVSFFAVDRQRESFIPMSSNEAAACSGKICKLIQPTHLVVLSVCGVGFLKGGTLAGCKIESIPAHPFFQPIEAGLLYSVPTQTLVAVTCPFPDSDDKDTTSMISLEGSGLLQLNGGCQATIVGTKVVYRGPPRVAVQITVRRDLLNLQSTLSDIKGLSTKVSHRISTTQGILTDIPRMWTATKIGFLILLIIILLLVGCFCCNFTRTYLYIRRIKTMTFYWLKLLTGNNFAHQERVSYQNTKSNTPRWYHRLLHLVIPIKRMRAARKSQTESPDEMLRRHVQQLQFLAMKARERPTTPRGTEPESTRLDTHVRFSPPSPPGHHKVTKVATLEPQAVPGPMPVFNSSILKRYSTAQVPQGNKKPKTQPGTLTPRPFTTDHRFFDLEQAEAQDKQLRAEKREEE